MTATLEVLNRCPDTGRPLTVRWPDGRYAESMRNEFDCLRCVLAFVTGCRYVHVPEIPPPGAGELAERLALARIEAFVGAHGWDVVRHDDLAAVGARRSWIGAVPGDEFGPSHCVAMRFGEVEFDPAIGFPLPAGRELVPVTPADVSWGLTLDSRRACAAA